MMDSLADAQYPWKERARESGSESVCVCWEKVIERRPLEIFFHPIRIILTPHPSARSPCAGEPATAPISALTLSQRLLDAAWTCVTVVIRIAGLMLN